jgi:hypothetical protein
MKKSSLVERFDRWHKTKVGLLTFGLVELAGCYILVSRAIHTGSLWQYALGAVFLVGAVQNFVRIFRKK